MSTRSDSGPYVDLIRPEFLGGRDPAWHKPRAWDTDHDGYQNGVKTDLPHAVIPVLENGAPTTRLSLLYAVQGPFFCNVAIYLKRIDPLTATLAGPLAPPPNITMQLRTGMPCMTDAWVKALIQLTDYKQAGLLFAGVLPFAQALELYAGIIPSDSQPANSVHPVSVKLRIVVSYSGNDLGLATFETAHADASNGITVTLTP